MLSIFAFGLVMGVRHAFEGDHLAAVATLATREGDSRADLLRGAAWGLGHTITLLLVGAVCLFLGAAVPERWASRLELVVGVMLLGLGIDTLLRLHRRPGSTGDRAEHSHPHPPGTFPGRAFVVGLVHGLAGSAALFLLTLQTVGSFWPGLAYIALFGLGSILGMAVLSAAIALPLRAAAAHPSRVRSVLELAVGIGTIAIGIRICMAAVA